MKKLSELTNTELLEIADLFVKSTHSQGWKIAESKSLMSDDYTNFIEYTKDNCKQDIISYLTNKGYPLLNNRLFN